MVLERGSAMRSIRPRPSLPSWDHPPLSLPPGPKESGHGGRGIVCVFILALYICGPLVHILYVTIVRYVSHVAHASKIEQGLWCTKVFTVVSTVHVRFVRFTCAVLTEWRRGFVRRRLWQLARTRVTVGAVLLSMQLLRRHVACGVCVCVEGWCVCAGCCSRCRFPRASSRFSRRLCA